MSMQIDIELDGTILEAIENIDSVSLQLNFDRDKDTFVQKTSISNIVTVFDINEKILEKIEDGKTGAGPGIFEGIPLNLRVTKGSEVEIPFKGYVDLSDNPKLSCMESDLKIVEKDSIDWLNEIADSFTFQYLHEISGEITNEDFYWVPYILNSIPNYTQAAISLLSVFYIEQQIEAAVQKITELGVEMANPFEASSIVRAVLYVIYLIVLIASLIILIKSIISLIIQPIKYHAGMFALDLCKKGAEHLGYTFKSPEILESETLKDFFILPQKTRNPPNIDNNNILGFTNPGTIDQKGYFKGTFGDFLRIMQEEFDAKVIVTNDKEIFLVPQQYNVSVPIYQLPDLYQPEYTFNTKELISNYLIEFETDLIDKNTLQNYQGTIFQAIAKPNTTINSNMVLLKGLRSREIGHALATRKEELTLPEKIIKDFVEIFDTIINALISAVNVVIDIYNDIVKVLNKIIDALDFIGIDVGWEIPEISNIDPVDLTGLIENRIGMLVLEIDSTSQPKGFLMKRGSSSKFNKIYENNREIISAKWLYENFHSNNSFVPSAARPNGNQYRIKEFENVPFTFKNYQEVKLNNRIFDANGNEAFIDSLEWFIRNQIANMTVRFSELYTNNLLEDTIYPNGN